MKKTVILLFAAACVLWSSGCRGDDSLSGRADGSMPGVPSGSTSSVPDGSLPTVKTWTEAEILELFSAAEDHGDWMVHGCAAVTDFAFDRIGVVLFTDREEQTVNVAFLSADGFYQTCGVYAQAYGDGGLTYCGDGAVTFQGVTQEERVTYRISFSTKEAGVNFQVESFRETDGAAEFP